MATEMRKTGVDVVGDIPWGTHFCLFYETRADLLETLVSYCKAGLENQEFCLWVVAEPLTGEDARHALKRAVPDLDQYLADHSIEIVAARDWYLQDRTFDLNRVISDWNEKLARASARGYAGVTSGRCAREFLVPIADHSVEIKRAILQIPVASRDNLYAVVSEVLIEVRNSSF